jgi:hypothetical protein
MTANEPQKRGLRLKTSGTLASGQGGGQERDRVMVTVRLMLHSAPAGAIFASSVLLAGFASSFFFGLPHTPLGNATLGLDPSSGELVVSNLGSSGQDGVSIGLGGVTGFRAAVDIGPQGELPPGAIFQMDAFAPAPVASGQSQKTLGLLICEILTASSLTAWCSSRRSRRR